jgi:hypothetical protein
MHRAYVQTLIKGYKIITNTNVLINAFQITNDSRSTWENQVEIKDDGQRKWPGGPLGQQPIHLPVQVPIIASPLSGPQMP